MRKYSDSNKFFEDDLDKVMQRMVPTVTGTKLLPVLLSCAGNKNQQIRFKTASALARIITTVLVGITLG